MTPRFDHEKLRAYQEALRFCAWVEAVLEMLPARLSARDNLDRASTSTVLNIAEGNGKRSRADRCRYLDIARGSTVECAACLDVLVAKGRIGVAEANAGKEILIAVVSLVSGLIARWAPQAPAGTVEEEAAGYLAIDDAENENE